MIDNILNGVLNKASSTLSDSKDKILAASKKKAQENLDFDLPSPEGFKSKLLSLEAPQSTESLVKANEVYNKTVNQIEKAIKKLTESKKELEAIKTNLNSINDRFDFFESLTSDLQPLVELFEITLPISIDAGLAASTGPVASGTVINKLGELKDGLKNAVKKFKDGNAFFNRSTSFVRDEMKLLLNPLDLGISGLQEAIDKLQLILDQLKALFANFLLAQNLPEVQKDDDTSTSGDNPNGNEILVEYLDNNDDLSNIVTDLIIPSRKVFYETREDGPGTELYKAGITEQSIN